MDYGNKFIERLDELMQETKVSVKQLSMSIHIPASTISTWRTNKNLVYLPNIIKLADYFKCTVDFLIGRSDDSSMPFIPMPCPSFPQQLRKIMNETGWSRSRMDRETKFKDCYFCSWDKGKLPQILTLIELADLFDVSIDYLIGRER